MPRQMREVNVKGTDWSQANCRGLNTEIFYLEESELKDRGMTTRVIRKVCFTCPIQRECLRAGMEEEYGIWGGFTKWERTKIRNQRLADDDLNPARRQLEEFGITLEEAIEGAA
jgi:Transcription factor WhiB